MVCREEEEGEEEEVCGFVGFLRVGDVWPNSEADILLHTGVPGWCV